jgi:hypothetical protein
MLTKVEVRNPQGALLSLSFVDLDSGLLVQDITGLDPVKATISTSEFATIDGQQYQSSRREARNIVLQIGLEPDYETGETMFDLRNQVYGFFMPKSQVALRFYTVEGLEVDTLGRVESCETSIFSQEPAIDISVICFDPDFLDADGTTISDETTGGTGELLIDYDGTVGTGVKLNLELDRDIGEFALYHRTPDGQIRILEFSEPLLTGDVVEINTVKGEKGATLTRSTVDSPITRAITPQSVWTQLQPGANYIRVYVVGPGIPFTLSYVTRYGGL